MNELKYGGKKVLPPSQRPNYKEVGARPNGTPHAIFHKSPNVPTAEQLMKPPVEQGYGNIRDNTPYLTVDDLDPNWLELMVEEAKQGRGPTSFMRALDITKSAFETLLATSPEFAEAYERCLILSSEWWEDRGRDMAMGEKGNSQVWLANMVNRWGWNSERRDNIGDPNIKLSINSSNKELTDEELDAELSKRGLSLDFLNPNFDKK